MQIKAVRKDYNTYDIVVFVRKIFGKGFQEAETIDFPMKLHRITGCSIKKCKLSKS